MILVDTSVWIDHLREGQEDLIDLLENAQVACHPFIVGELACGSLKNRVQILSLLQSLPMAMVAEHSEVLRLIENKRLMNRGLGYIDVQLLASALLANISMWTLDKRLNQASAELGISHNKMKGAPNK